MKYQARHKRNKTIKEIELSISEVDQWEKDNPAWEIVIGAPGIHSGGGLGLRSMQSNEGFKDRVREIDKSFPGNTLKNYVDF